MCEGCSNRASMLVVDRSHVIFPAWYCYVTTLGKSFLPMRTVIEYLNPENNDDVS